jgi:maternal-effect protein exuperantia
MPYKNPNPGARRSFGIKVVSIGRYRMLKDVETGRILKTKSEISAIQEFIDWLKEAKGSKDGVLLVCHEPTRKVLVPLLLEALYRYNLVNNFILKKKKKSLECNLLRYSWQ